MEDDPYSTQLGEFLQKLGAEQSGDLITEWAVVVGAAHRSEEEATAYRIYSEGTISRTLGLLRYGTLRVEHDLTDGFGDES